MSKVKRIFFPGDAWMFYKLYMGPSTTERFLREILPDLLLALKMECTLDTWFFVRYADPEHHLRLRFKIGPECISKVTRLMNSCVAPFANAEFIHKVEVSSYERELERYGVPHIETAEELFAQNSKQVLQVIQLLGDHEEEHWRWLLALRGMDAYFENAAFSLSEKTVFTEWVYKAFGTEFKSDKSFKKAVDRKFRNHLALMSCFLEKTIDETVKIPRRVQQFSFEDERQRTALLAIQRSCTKEQFNAYLQSYLHMFFNRLFQSRQRQFELVIYGLAYRYYKKQWGRQTFRKNHA